MCQRILKKVPLLDCRSKLEISISLSCFAMLIWAVRNNPDSKMCMCAMFVCTVGDILLNYQPVENRSHTLLYLGAGAFMVAHVLYGFAFYKNIIMNSFRVVNIGFVFAIVSLTVVVLTILAKLSKIGKPKLSMIIVFTGYIFFIGFNFSMICSYSWSKGSLAAIGAVSFLISDLIIGVENLFKVKSETLRKLVWIFYPIGQILILSAR